MTLAILLVGAVFCTCCLVAEWRASGAESERRRRIRAEHERDYWRDVAREAMRQLRAPHE